MAPEHTTPDPAMFEKLGAFYLGRSFDQRTASVTDDLVLYDAKDLTTHAVCVGMTGSGKTGLCVSLLEEAALDRIPAIAIDPKGDLTNLLLTFPNLAPADFLDWIDPSEAERKGQTAEQYAASVSAKWKSGLADWGQDGERIRRLREAAEFTVYTPGSNAGIPLTVLRSFSAPPAALVEDADAFRERVAAAVSGLLALVGVDADPVQSREHILLSTLFDLAWRDGRDLDLAALVNEIQNPPVKTVGVMEIDAFFPAKERFALAMRLNGLLASPGFSAWLEGEPLDIPQLLWTPDGRPRIAVISIAHLSDAERMFFVTILLNETIAWMRSQPGTPSLRALLYMDEVFGYFPPTANPPSKVPMLTLLKQARAYGVGVVLATQNPVDLDYKGLSNAGTWFLGRLQTERDKQRVLDGLEGAAVSVGGGFDRKRLEETLAGLKSRVFLMHNVHEDGPALFHTRWAMSYLRGPMTRAQIQTLMADRSPSPGPERRDRVPRDKEPVSTDRPALPQAAAEGFLPVARAGGSNRLLYRPAVVATADLHFANSRLQLDEWSTVSFLAPLGGTGGARVWKTSQRLPQAPPALDDSPAGGGEFAKVPAAARKDATYATWEKSFKTHCYQECAVTLYRHPPLKLQSRPGETEAEFRVRLREAAREKRDVAIDKLRRRYAPKIGRLEERIRRAQEKVGREQSQYKQQKLQTALSMGATVLGALLGRKAASVGTVGRATTAARGMGRAAREKEDIARAERDLAAAEEKLRTLEVELQSDLTRVGGADVEGVELTNRVVRPRKADISVHAVRFAWAPFYVTPDGVAEAAYD